MYWFQPDGFKFRIAGINGWPAPSPPPAEPMPPHPPPPPLPPPSPAPVPRPRLPFGVTGREFRLRLCWLLLGGALPRACSGGRWGWGVCVCAGFLRVAVFGLCRAAWALVGLAGVSCAPPVQVSGGVGGLLGDGANRTRFECTRGCRAAAARPARVSTSGRARLCRIAVVRCACGAAHVRAHGRSRPQAGGGGCRRAGGDRRRHTGARGRGWVGGGSRVRGVRNFCVRLLRVCFADGVPTQITIHFFHVVT